MDISKSSIQVVPINNPEILGKDLSQQSKIYAIKIDDDYLKTPNGKLITHGDDRPMRELAAELEYTSELDPSKINLYSLCSTQIDLYEDEGLNLDERFLIYSILNDPVLRTCTGPEVKDQLKYLMVVLRFIEGNGIEYPYFPQIPFEDLSFFAEINSSDTNQELDFSLEIAKIGDPLFGENINRLFSFFKDEIDKLDKFQLAAFSTATHVYESPTLGLMLANRLITPHEFSVLYLTGQCINSKVWPDSDIETERRYKEDISKKTEYILRYLQQFRQKSYEIENLISIGETKNVEFKSSLRWNIRENKKDKVMEYMIVKTMAAFLNTDGGGTLLVGVEDDGNIMGIEVDGFPNADKYLLHFVSIVNKYLGKHMSKYINSDLYNVKGKEILCVRCMKSAIPVVINFQGNDEFFIRFGPSSQKLSLREALEYQSKHF